MYSSHNLITREALVWVEIFTEFHGVGSCSMLKNRSNDKRPLVLPAIQSVVSLAWAFYQICIIAGCPCAGNAENVFPTIAAQRSRHASRHVRVLSYKTSLDTKPVLYQDRFCRLTCVADVSWCMPGSLISGFLWSQWRGKRPWHWRRMGHPHFGLSGKKPIALWHGCVILGEKLYMFYSIHLLQKCWYKRSRNEAIGNLPIA